MGNKVPREQANCEKVKAKYVCFSAKVKCGLLQDCQNLFYLQQWKDSEIEVCKAVFRVGKGEEVQINNEFLLISRNQPMLEAMFLYLAGGSKRIIMIKFESLQSFIKNTALILISKRPSWILSTLCQICAKPFSFFSRSHHCRYCGSNICASCSNFRRLDILGYIDLQRVCNLCPGLIEEVVLIIAEIRHNDLSSSLNQNLYDLPYNQSVLESELII